MRRPPTALKNIPPYNHGKSSAGLFRIDVYQLKTLAATTGL